MKAPASDCNPAPENPVRTSEVCGSNLNHACRCRTLDLQKLAQLLESSAPSAVQAAGQAALDRQLFANVAVFVTAAQIREMQTIVRDVVAVTRLAEYREAALQWAPVGSSAAVTTGGTARPSGICMGFDFHLGSTGPQLIEINTNAGGAFLNAALLQAQALCCNASVPDLGRHPGAQQQLVEMFFAEWNKQRPPRDALRIAIVDDQPSGQFLYPEFVLAQRWLRERGCDTRILDPQELTYDGQALRQGDFVIDLVYNRLTDFALEAAQHQPLKAAWFEDAVVLTPHPAAHALLADKRNLTLLSDAERLRSWGVPTAVAETIGRGVPLTRPLDRRQAEAFWSERKNWFFKPASGFGSRATYRGAKITKKVWQEILDSEQPYIAQALVPPNERTIWMDGHETKLKMDIRAYVYEDRIFLFAARLYQGQTTNFRTPGGGFAPVFVMAD